MEVISRSSTRDRIVSHERPFAFKTPQPMPSSKKEMAKKRTFAEIIDLTQQLSDEDDPDSHQPENNDTTDHLEPPNGHTVMEKQDQDPLRSEMLSAPVVDEESMDLSKFRYASSQRDLLQSETIIKPMNKRSDALRRDSYNARTIARDILVASGKHPAMAPLNYHLEILRKKFRHVDTNSDLTTFKWDLVDPGEPIKITDVANDAHDANVEGTALKLNGVDRDNQSQVATAINGDDVIMIGWRDVSVWVAYC